jgi:hypothetical protein
MMNTKIEILLDSITALVDDNEPWGNKRDKIKELIKDNERWETAFLEFIGWFESEEEDEDEDEDADV